MDESELITSLQRAVDASPEDVTLRLHLAQMLIGAGRGQEAVAHAAAVLQRDPDSQTARGLMSQPSI